jgi:hypothetical protein
MKKTAYGKPIFLSENNDAIKLKKVENFDEAFIQNLIFNNPDCLPISDIDESYNPLIPVCVELNTPVGPLDILMITPNGEIVIVETKLWRNSGARRTVIAQILDYAKELSNWTYDDLQRESNKNLKTKDNILYTIAKKQYPDLTPSESDFVDSVSRNLARGKFLLLIAGDGIREGAYGITEFLATAGHLNFAFAMVELNVFEGEGLGRLIIPKTIVKTVEIQKLRVEIPDGFVISSVANDEDPDNKKPVLSPQQKKEKQFYYDFWMELIRELNFDDPGQLLPNPSQNQNIYIYPGQTKKVWISAFFAKSKKTIGVYFRTQKDTEGEELSLCLDDYRAEIKGELGGRAVFKPKKTIDVGIRLSCDDIFSSNNRKEIKEFFKEELNNFVNVFRPKLKKIESDN